jgi:pyruvate dehydrogenase E1 component alpha subunit
VAQVVEPGASAAVAEALARCQPRLDRLPEPYRVLDPDGAVCGPLPDLSDEQLVGMYRWMVFGRCLDERGLQLQRQGRITVWAPGRGQEACQAGLALAMGPDDWLLPSYREPVALVARGLDLSDLFQYYRGWYWQADPAATGVYPLQILIGDQALHAVGAGMAFALQERPTVAVAVIGDGATSQGDFHEALNFGGVFQAKAMIFVENNQWAISVPRARQTASPTLIQKALGFGITGYLVDGNDPLAVYEISRQALAHARSGQGTALIEALTYRIGAHTTADDPKRYQPPEEIDDWTARDPLKRLRRFLETRGLWSDAAEEQSRRESLAQIDAAMARAEAAPPRSFATVFETTFAQPTSAQLEQRQRVTSDE